MRSTHVLLSVSLVTSLLITSVFSSTGYAQQQKSPMRRARVVSITFDGSKPQQRRPLTREERAKQSALIRHEKRLRVGANQSIPF